MYQHANQFRGAWISGPQEFDHLVTLPSGILQDSVSMAGKVINPQDPSAIISVADVPNLLELAPVTMLANLDGTYDVLAQETCWAIFVRLDITLRCHPDQQVGVSAVAHYWFGYPDGSAQEVLFPRGTPTSGYLNIVNSGGTLSTPWSYDGSNTLTFPYLFRTDDNGNWMACSIPFN
jgi:hypothetical protein